jgi:hypothetical protein
MVAGDLCDDFTLKEGQQSDDLSVTGAHADWSRCDLVVDWDHRFLSPRMLIHDPDESEDIFQRA